MDSCTTHTQAGGLASLKGFTYFFSPEPDTEVLLDRLHWVLLASLSGTDFKDVCVYGVSPPLFPVFVSERG